MANLMVHHGQEELEGLEQSPRIPNRIAVMVPIVVQMKICELCGLHVGRY